MGALHYLHSHTIVGTYFFFVFCIFQYIIYPSFGVKIVIGKCRDVLGEKSTIIMNNKKYIIQTIFGNVFGTINNFNFITSKLLSLAIRRPNMSVRNINHVRELQSIYDLHIFAFFE